METSEKHTCNSPELCYAGGLPNTCTGSSGSYSRFPVHSHQICTADPVILNSGFDKCCRGYCTQWWSGREEALLSGTAAHRTRASSKTTWSWCGIVSLLYIRGNALFGSLTPPILSEFCFKILSPFIPSVLLHPLGVDMSFMTFRVLVVWMVPWEVSDPHSLLPNQRCDYSSSKELNSKD